MTTIRIGTRKSELAMWQANFVAASLRDQWADLDVKLVPIKTKGDKILDKPLVDIGDKALFTKELEDALLAKKIDAAVHSLKDLPTKLPEGLTIGCILKRGPGGDAWVSKDGNPLSDVPDGATIATGSLRRRAQLLNNNPELNIVDLRGNVGTRLQKLEDNKWAGIILAEAGLIRLEKEDLITEIISTDIMLPAVGQGALAIEIREDDADSKNIFDALEHPDTRSCVLAERALLRRLEGGCQVPIGAKAVVKDGKLKLEAMIASLDGSRMYRDSIESDPADAEQTGIKLAEKLLKSGGQAILDEIIAMLNEKEEQEKEVENRAGEGTSSEQTPRRHFKMNISKSGQLFEQAQESLVGGVNSPVRAFRGVGGTPLFIKRAEGPYMWDADGNKYIDYVGSWGPMILGHAHPEVIEAICKAAEHGTSFGTPTDLEIHLAEEFKKMVKSVELVRMVNSGTEATMSAIRLARGFTGKDKIIKFDGCYHGHADSFLVQAGSGALTLGTPDSPGVPAELVKHTLSAQFNDLDSVKAQINEYEDEIAAIIVEPVAGNMGVIPPAEGFLEGLRNICDANNIILIFDEVMTGFRVAPGGAQERFGIKPDLSTFGKILGGGMPVGAFGGSADIMKHLSPVGPVYQAGTLSGNPLAMAAGLATLRLLQEVGVYEKLEKKATMLEDGLKVNINRIDAPITLTRVGSMSCLFFNPGPVTNFAEAKKSDTKRYGLYYHAMLARGVYLAPSQFEAAFLSLTHSEEDIERTIAANKEALEEAFTC